MRNFQILIVLQSKYVNNVCKLLQLLAPDPTEEILSPDRLVYRPQLKMFGACHPIDNI